MNWFRMLFPRKKQRAVPPAPSQVEPIERVVPPKPSWDETVEAMYDKGLDGFMDDVVKVFYSKDKTKRFIVLKNEKSLLTYWLEELIPFSDDEWYYFSDGGRRCPATWLSHRIAGNSIFDNEEALLKALKEEPEYKLYFS